MSTMVSGLTAASICFSSAFSSSSVSIRAFSGEYSTVSSSVTLSVCFRMMVSPFFMRIVQRISLVP